MKNLFAGVGNLSCISHGTCKSHTTPARYHVAVPIIIYRLFRLTLSVIESDI